MFGRNIKEPEIRQSGAKWFRSAKISMYDNLSVLASLMSNMSMPSSFFALLHSDTVGCILGWSAAFSGWVTGVTGGVTNLHDLV